MAVFPSLAARFMSGVMNSLLDFGYGRALAKAKSQAGAAKEEKAEIVRWRNIYGVTKTPWSLEQDFLLRRSPVYIHITKACYVSY